LRIWGCSGCPVLHVLLITLSQSLSVRSSAQRHSHQQTRVGVYRQGTVYMVRRGVAGFVCGGVCVCACAFACVRVCVCVFVLHCRKLAPKPLHIEAPRSLTGS